MGHANILTQISPDIIKFVGFRLSKAKSAQNFAPIYFLDLELRSKKCRALRGFKNALYSLRL
jgi:hypothetical protein